MSGGVRPFTIVCGALGSGKTTLLRRLLRQPGLAGTYVVVNEFGEIGIDQEQLKFVSERVALLPNSCVCCATRDDVIQTLSELMDAEADQQLPRMTRVVLETSGLADPAPIVATLLSSPLMRHHFAVDRVVTTVDATHAAPHDPTWLQQVICADSIAVTKTDLAADRSVEELHEVLRGLNPAAVVTAAENFELEQSARSEPVVLRAEPLGPSHRAGVESAAVQLTRPVSLAAFAVWISALLHAHGTRILRLKAMLDTGGAGPVIIDGVQHVVYPPRHLPSWSESPVSRIVVITRDLPARDVLAAFVAFVAPAGDPPSPDSAPQRG